MVLYPSTSLHRVTPVTRGTRVASFFWLQSMVRDDGERTLLFQLDANIQQLVAERGHRDPVVVQLTGIYHNMLRRWADSRSEEHTSELQSLMRISYAVFCLKKKNKDKNKSQHKNKHRK